MVPTVYLVNAPLSNSALPDDLLIDTDGRWFLQREVSAPTDMASLTRLRRRVRTPLEETPALARHPRPA